MNRIAKHSKLTAIDVGFLQREGLRDVILACYKVHYPNLRPRDYEAEAWRLAHLSTESLREKARVELASIQAAAKDIEDLGNLPRVMATFDPHEMDIDRR